MTVCENLFIQGRTRSGLLRAHLALVPGSALIGSEDNADGTQLEDKVFIYVSLVLFCRAGSDMPGAFKHGARRQSRSID